MPELPEVETIRLTIWPQLDGRRIERVDVLHPDVVAGVSPAQFVAVLTGARFARSSRRGKYLMFELTPAPPDAGGQPAASPVRVLVHLRMTGRLSCVARDQAAPPHTHLRLALGDGTDLLFTDTRRFGRWTVIDCPLPVDEGQPGAAAAPLALAAGGPKGFRLLGPEPLGDDLTVATFAAGLGKRHGKLKAVLLDQCFVAGIGNIYADEIMHRARLHPLRAADSLTVAETSRLYTAMRLVLQEAIGKGGTTIRDYVDGSGRKGDFVYSLRVYGRTGQECTTPGCGGTIERIVVAGRSTHFCARCQPAQPDGSPLADSSELN